MSKITHEAAISQEISSLEHQMRYAIELRAKIAEATDELQKNYMGLIYAKEEFEKTKKQNIEEIRSYKFAIAAEAKEIEAAAKNMAAAVSSDRLGQLKEFVGVCERMQLLRNEGFFAAVRIDA